MEEALSRIPSYSRELGLDLSVKSDRFKWFIASMLYAKRISSKIASETFKRFVAEGLTDPSSIMGAGWDRIVEVLDSGGYVRYDFSTATNILENMRMLMERYGGDVDRIHECALDSRDLEGKLMEFRGFGPVAVNIFLRELRGFGLKRTLNLQAMLRLWLQSLG
ncbi:MAG: DNA methylase [archaeon YNP-WB-062]|nr:DNA methylase [Candidatus Culexarchaeum yellowstonense]